METRFSPDAESVLNSLEEDPDQDDRTDAVWNVIDMVAEDPGSAFARRRSLRTPAGHTVWMVLIPLRLRGDEESWVMLWQQQTEDEILIAYVGPADFRPWKS